VRLSINQRHRHHDGVRLDAVLDLQGSERQAVSVRPADEGRTATRNRREASGCEE
jgi:hypothetical protein